MLQAVHVLSASYRMTLACASNDASQRRFTARKINSATTANIYLFRFKLPLSVDVSCKEGTTIGEKPLQAS